MRRQAVIDATLHQDLHQLDVVRVNFGFLLKGNVCGFLVCAFTEANTNPLGQQLLHVALERSQVGLDDGADTILRFPECDELMDEIEGALGVGRAFHIDAHKVARVMAAALLDQRRDEIASHFSSTSRPM